MAKKRALTFQEWATKFGGIAAIAARLKLNHGSVKRWYLATGWPKVNHIRDLIEISGGDLTFESIIASTEPKLKAPVAVKRGRVNAK
jgi:hypothetical protein